MKPKKDNDIYHNVRGKLASSFLYMEILEKEIGEQPENVTDIMHKIKESTRLALELLKEIEMSDKTH